MYRHLVILFIIGCIGCAGTKDVFSFKKEDITFGLKKGACFGKCSIYSIDIYKNKVAVYEGLINATRYGVFSKKITKQEYNDLKKAYEAADFMSFDNMYSIEVEDLPLITMTYNNGKLTKTVLGKMGRPDKLIELQRMLEKIAASPDWKLEKAYEPQITNDVTEERLTVKGDVIESQIIIEPNPNVSLALWFKKYDSYGVGLIKKIAPNLNYWLINYDETKISAQDMLQMLQLDPDIKSAEFNKKVSPREH